MVLGFGPSSLCPRMASISPLYICCMIKNVAFSSGSWEWDPKPLEFLMNEEYLR